MMYKKDGTKCQSPEDNAEVFKKHFEIYNKPSNFDPSILDHLEDSPIDDPLGFTPSIEEVRSAINHLKNNSPGESGLNQSPRITFVLTTCFVSSPISGPTKSVHLNRILVG